MKERGGEREERGNKEERNRKERGKKQERKRKKQERKRKERGKKEGERVKKEGRRRKERRGKEKFELEHLPLNGHGCTENIFAGAKLEWRRQWAAIPALVFKKCLDFSNLTKAIMPCNCTTKAFLP